ncbi:MAG: transcriptional regulator [Methanobacteriota archaeon]|nr:MAG: transcriptional regulator [Euryarchaeota archaeon]
MNRQQLTDDLRTVLGKAGFFLSDKHDTRLICFDIVARKDDLLMIVKVLTNIDSFNAESAMQLKMISSILGASSLLVGERSGAGKIEYGVIYSRFGVPILSLTTISEFLLEGVPPFVFSAPGGLYVKMDGDIIRRIREKKRVSLGMLAETAGVSRRTIQMYEDGMGATLDVAIRLEEFLGQPLVVALNPFSYKDAPVGEVLDLEMFEGFEREVLTHLGKLGYSVIPTARCPFDVFTKDPKTVLLTGLGKVAKPLERRATIVANISRVVEKDSVIFVDRRRVRENIAGTPLIGSKELKKVKDREEILEIISERKK